jgi:hypothetical protein
VDVTVSKSKSTTPVPGEAFGGTSLEPFRIAWNGMMTAGAGAAARPAAEIAAIARIVLMGFLSAFTRSLLCKPLRRRATLQKQQERRTSEGASLSSIARGVFRTAGFTGRRLRAI